MISSSNPTSKLPILAAAIGLLAYAPVESHDVSTQQDYNNNFSLYAIVDYIDSITNNEDSSRENTPSNLNLYLFDIDSSYYVNNFLSSTYIRTEGFELNSINDHELINELVLHLLELIREDDDYSYNASKFITKQFEESETIGIEIIKTAVKKNAYRYARDVITAVRAANINYFQKWFKDLLIEGMARSSLKNYFQNIYELYKDSFDAI